MQPSFSSTDAKDGTVTSRKHAGIKEKIEGLIGRYLDGTHTELDPYLKAQGIQDINALDPTQRGIFADEIIRRFIKPRTSIGKSSLATVELYSILEIRRDGGQWEKVEQTANAEKADYSPDIAAKRGDNLSLETPGPKSHVLEDEVRSEFIKTQGALFSNIIEKIAENDRLDPKAKSEVLKSMVTELFGQMGRQAINFSGEPKGDYIVERTVNKNLNAYMTGPKAEESTKFFMNMADKVFKTKESGQTTVDEEKLSKTLMDYFQDMNQVVLRQLQNKYGVKEMETIPESKRKEIVMAVMMFYFGLISKKYLDTAFTKLQSDLRRDLKDEENVKLMNAIIYDCLSTSMKDEHANQAFTSMKKLMGL